MAALDDEGTVGTNEDDLRLMRLWTMVLPLTEALNTREKTAWPLMAMRHKIGRAHV